MRIPVSPYGVKELVVFSGGFFLLGLTLWTYVHPAAGAAPLLLGLFVISFFRDPHRTAPADKDCLLSPADGTVADITEVEDEDYLGKRSVKIGIFLSVFNVHLNRAPCPGRVDEISYRPGRFHDARHPNAGKENESLTMGLFSTRHDLKIVVRQIAGLIARRIVCRLREGDTVEGGERYGMIKFGSRTELAIPADRLSEILVKEGDKVKAGSTLLARIRASHATGKPPTAGKDEP